MRALGQSALFLGIFALTSLTPLGSSPLCAPVALAGESRNFEQDGRNGLNGRTGRNGQDQTVFANGSAVTLDLSGQNGTDGEDGENAQRARCRRQPNQPDRNLQAADGGNGGNGGNGSNGGNGGDGGAVTVYYTNPSDLKQIVVRSLGGLGGRAGRGGYGTAGCNCDRRRWEVKVCIGTHEFCPIH